MLLLVAVDAPQHYSARFIGGLVVGLVPTTATHVLAVVARWLPGWEGSAPGRPGSAMTSSGLVVAGDWVTVGLG